MKTKSINRAISFLLALIMTVACLPPMTAFAEDERTITAFNALNGAATIQTVAIGTPLTQLNLPSALLATMGSEGSVTFVTVTGWQSEPEYDPDVPGVYAFTPQFDTGYTVAKGVTAPVITVSIGEQSAAYDADEKTIVSFDKLDYEVETQSVAIGTTLDELNLPSTLSAFLFGVTSPAAITITGWQSTPEYDPDAQEVYAFEPTLDEDYTLAEGVTTPVIMVIVGNLPSIMATSAIVETDADTRSKLDTAKKGLQAAAALAGVKGFSPVTDIVFKIFGSDTNDVLSAINALNERFDNLETQLNTMSANLSHRIEKAEVLTGLKTSLTAYTTIASSAKTVNKVLITLKNKNTTDEDLNNFYLSTVTTDVEDYKFNGMAFRMAVLNFGDAITEPSEATGLNLLATYDKMIAYTYKWEHQGYAERTAFQARVASLYLSLSTFLKAALTADYLDAEEKKDKDRMKKADGYLEELDKQIKKVSNLFVDYEVNRLPNSLRNYQEPFHPMLLSAVAVPRTIYWTEYDATYKRFFEDFYQGVLFYDFTGKYDKTDHYYGQVYYGHAYYEFTESLRTNPAIHTYPTAAWFKNVFDDYSGGKNLLEIFFGSTEGNISRTLYDNFRTVTNGDIRPPDYNLKFMTEFGGTDAMYRRYDGQGESRGLFKTGPYTSTFGYYKDADSWDEYWLDLVNIYGNKSNTSGKVKGTDMAHVENDVFRFWYFNEDNNSSPNFKTRWLTNSANRQDKYVWPTHINDWENHPLMIGIVKMDRMKVTADGAGRLSVLDKASILPGNYKYEWQERAPDKGFVTINGANARTLDLSASFAAKSDYEYRCVISKLDANNNVIATEVETTFAIPLGGSLQFSPNPFTPTLGMEESYAGPYPGNITLSVPGSYDDAGIYSYQWEVSVPGSGFEAISNADMSSYALGTVDYSMNGNRYRCNIYYYDLDSGETVTMTTDPATLNLETFGDWPDYAAANFHGGVGTAEAPYIISSAEQLAYLAKQVNSGTDYSGKFIKLTEDVDLYEHYWMPIGVSSIFSGSFDGGDHTISSLTIENEDDSVQLGLFGHVDGGTIENLTLMDVHITSTADGVGIGGLAGVVADSVVTNCGVWSTIESVGDSTNIGGLVGYSNGSEIIGCKTGVDVKSTGDNTFVGGLVGVSEDGEITDSFAVSSIESSGGYIDLGGLVGYSVDSTIHGCFATGTVSGTNDGTTEGEVVVGGLVGVNLNTATISESFAAVQVNGTNEYNDESTGSVYVGGLVGLNDNNAGGLSQPKHNDISDCYAGMSTEGYSTYGVAYVGGLIGVSDGGSVDRCYAKETVNGSGNPSHFINGFFGAAGELGGGTDLYWDKETTGKAYGGAMLGMDENNMMYMPYSDLATQAMTDNNVLTTGAMAGSDDPDHWYLNGLGSAWTKTANDNQARYYPTLKAFAESGDYTRQMFSSLSVMVFNPIITFDAQGGTVSPEYAQTGPDYTLLTLPTPTRSGYTFGGWYTNEFYMQGVTTETIFTTDWTIYAKWTKNSSGGDSSDGGSPGGSSSGRGSSGGGSSGGGSSVPTPEPAPTASTVIVDGKEVNAGEVKTSGDVTTVIINQDALNKLLETATRNVTIVVPEGTGTAVAQLVMQNVDDMAAKDMTLTVQFGNIQYEIPAASIDTAAILKALGAENATDVTINITITADMSEAALAAVKAAIDDGAELVIPPMEFKITATYNGKTVEINAFSQYVTRTVEITAEQAARITTAIVIDPDGKTRHVPTRVYEKDGKWYTEASSLTNSTYAFVSNKKTFTDAIGKWYENVVNEMGSRMIISGIGNNLFAGERDISRAEFAAIVVRALGLPSTGNGTVFTDVSRSTWYCGAVGTAYEYGLVSGIGNNLFAPDKKITRQEAMLMIRSAAKIAGFNGSAGNLNAFSDAENVSAWALEAAKWNVGSSLVVGFDGKIRPLDNITRAETAALVLKLLQKAGLVNVRTAQATKIAALAVAPPRKEPDPIIMPDDNDDESPDPNNGWWYGRSGR